MPRGLFVGLTTVDLVFGLQGFPQPNSKSVLREWALMAGGPAANAAVAFQALGGEATLLTVLGRHALASVAAEDLSSRSVHLRDLAPEYDQPPAFASVLVSSPGGDRMAVSSGALHLPKPVDDEDVISQVQPDLVLVDGHLSALSIAVARRARQAGIPVLLDGGSWKEGCDETLAATDIAICGEDFYPPGTENTVEVLDYLQSANVPYAAVTRGERTIEFRTAEGSGSVSPQAVEAVDTLGAGDIFHGAFARRWAEQPGDLRGALRWAARIAGQSCRWFGTREWLNHLEEIVPGLR